MAPRAPVSVRILTALLSGVMALAWMTGCSRIGADDPDPTGVPPTNVSTDTEAAPTETAVTAELAAPDPALLTAERGTLTSGELTVTNLLVNHEMPGLALALDIVRGQIVRQHQWGGGGQLSITPTLIASSTKAVAVALRATTAGGTSTSVVYYDPQSNHSFASTALITPAQWQTLVATASERAGDQRDAAAAQMQEPTFPNGNGPAIGFSADGDLVIIFQNVDGTTVDPVVIPGDEAAGMLTPLGTHARAGARFPTAAQAPDAFIDLDPALVGSQTVAPTSTSSPTSMPAGTPAATADPRPPLRLGTDCRAKKCVALTFDDGPLPQTLDLVAALNTLQAPATFFMLGSSVDQFPAIVTTVAANGMEIASHNQFHHDMSKMGKDRLTSQVGTAAQNLRTLTGADPLFLRPPYGARDKRSDAIVGKQGMAVALWSVDTEDWKHSKGSSAAAQSAIIGTLTQQIGNGGVILMHDIHANSRAAAPAVVATLREQGYTLVTLAELAPADFRFGKAFCSSPQINKSCVR